METGYKTCFIRRVGASVYSYSTFSLAFFFFFQAEDGIRDADVTGVQTCALPISLTSGTTLTVEIDMTASLSESVTVREEEGLLSTSETTTSNTIRSQTLNDVPLRSENFQSALLLTPGVVRGLDSVDHQKGARAGQSAYTMNGVDITDPATGNLAFDIPLEAAANVRVEENPYSAEFGRLTGGATELETKTG